MIHILLLVFSTASARNTKWEDERETVLLDRLKKYQNLTEIPDEKIDQIWRMRNDNTKQGIIPMAQVYATDKIPTGNPAIFRGISFNEDMIYNNGVFLILAPGYYRIDVNLRMGYRTGNGILVFHAVDA